MGVTHIMMTSERKTMKDELFSKLLSWKLLHLAKYVG